MFEIFLKKATVELSLKQFKLAASIRDENNDVSSAIFLKAESPVIYFIAISDYDRMSPSEYENILLNLMNETLANNLNLFNDAICINLLCGSNIQKMKCFADSHDNTYDSKIHNIWWYFDSDLNKIFAGEGQPDKVNGIDKIFAKAIGRDLVDADYSIKKLNALGNKDAELKQVAKFPLLVVFLIVINVIIFAYMTLRGESNSFIYKFGISNELVFSDNQFYRLFTYMFIHGGVEHILVNCLSLYIYGSKIEKYCGRIKMLAIYIVSGLAGGIISAYFNDGYAVGASGAIFGLLGAMLAITKKTRKHIDGFDYMTMIVLALVSIGMGFANPQIDIFGHIGGIIGGFVLGYLLYEDK